MLKTNNKGQIFLAHDAYKTPRGKCCVLLELEVDSIDLFPIHKIVVYTFCLLGWMDGWMEQPGFIMFLAVQNSSAGYTRQ